MASSTLLVTVFAFTWHLFSAAHPECVKPALPELRYADLQSIQSNERGYFLHNTNYVTLDNHLKDRPAEGAYLAHEVTHFMQDQCKLPRLESEAYDMQYAYDDAN